MDFNARLARVNSVPSRSEDAHVKTVLLLEVHDLETGWLTEQIGKTLECRVEPAPVALTPMERAINAATDTTPIVRTMDDGSVVEIPAADAAAQQRVVEAEQQPETNGSTPAAPGRRKR